MKINVGDIVRSYDFEIRKDCYIEGVVLAIVDRGGCNRYEILVKRYVVEDIERNWPGENVYPPVNGTPIWGDPDNLTNGVELIERGPNA